MEVLGFGIALTALSLLSFGAGRPAMLRTALALLANWLCQIIHYHFFQDPTPWVFDMAIDAVTAWVILLRPSGKMQAMLGWTFLFEISAHTAYGLLKLRHGYDYVEQLNYWEWLRNIARLQITMVGMWFVDGLAQRILGDRYNRNVPWHRCLAKAHDHKSVV